LVSTNSTPSFRGGSAANIPNKEKLNGNYWQNMGLLNKVLTQES
jgi:hypothetical protein